MSWNYYGFRPYVSVAERRAKAAREMAKLAKKGKAIRPVHISGRTIAHTFWGKAWCDNLERYSDFSNRLPRAVEITLFLQPVEEGEEPLEMKRVVQIPMSDASWGK